jgi:hypothetical protein
MAFTAGHPFLHFLMKSMILAFRSDNYWSLGPPALTEASCRLLHYTTERIVACLDDLHDHLDLTNQNMPNITAPHKSLHFVFMGDSRIRQQFFNFVKVSQSKIEL